MILSIVAALVACDNTPTGPSVRLSERFTLAPGESVSVRDTSLTVTFLRVSGDSRCPADAICIQGGDAIVHVRVDASSAAEYELHTGDQARASVMHAGFRITLTEVQPYPFSSRPIQPGDYRVTLVATR
ncbi:MAG: hypothetical protein ABL986_03410 [Vicinamibacterales bacterium]